jgi:HEAT repeat protein
VVVIAALINALGDSYELVRNASAKALGHFGQPALPALVSAMTHENEWVRAKSAFAIGRVGLDAKDAVPVLENALRDTSRRVRSKSARALNRIRALVAEEEQERIMRETKKSAEAMADMSHSGKAGREESE